MFLSAIGFLFGAHWLTYFFSIKLSSASIGAIGLSTYGLHLTILNWLLMKQKPKIKNVIAIILAIVGNFIIIPEFSLDNSDTLGLVIGITSGFVYAFVPILHQKSKEIPTSSRTLAQFSIALIFFSLFAPMGGWDFPQSDWPALIFMGLVCTLMGHALWVKATTQLPIRTISCIFYMGLPFTLLFEFLLLHNQIASYTLIGATLIIAANLINID